MMVFFAPFRPGGKKRPDPEHQEAPEDGDQTETEEQRRQAARKRGTLTGAAGRRTVLGAGIPGP